MFFSGEMILHFSGHPVSIEDMRTGFLLWDFHQNVSDLCPPVSHIRNEDAKDFHRSGAPCSPFGAHPVPASSGSWLSLCPRGQCAELSVSPQHPGHAPLTQSFVVSLTVGQCLLTDTETLAVEHVLGRSKE